MGIRLCVGLYAGVMAACSPCTGSGDACDVQDGDCQKKAMEAAACWLELDALDDDELPEVRFISTATYAGQTQNEAAADPLFAERERLLFEMGLIEGPTDFNAPGVGGFYEPKEKRITIVGMGSDVDAEYSLMVHEMAHALQDREHDLQGWFEGFEDPSTDVVVGLRTVVEGQAEFAQIRTLAELFEEDYEALDWSSIFEQTQGALATDFSSVSSPLWAVGGVPYLYGLEEEVRSDLEDRKARWSFGRPPMSSFEAVTHRASESLALRADFGPSYTILQEDSLGAWIVAVGYQSSDLEHAVESWSRDHLWLLQGPEGYVFVWRIDLETEAAAFEVASGFDRKSVRRAVRGRTVLGVTGIRDTSEAETLFEAAFAASIESQEPKFRSPSVARAVSSVGGCIH